MSIDAYGITHTNNSPQILGGLRGIVYFCSRNRTLEVIAVKVIHVDVDLVFKRKKNLVLGRRLSLKGENPSEHLSLFPRLRDAC